MKGETPSPFVSLGVLRVGPGYCPEYLHDMPNKHNSFNKCNPIARNKEKTREFEPVGILLHTSGSDFPYNSFLLT